MEERLYALQRHLPEALQLERLLHDGARWLRHDIALNLDVQGQTLPVHVIELGSRATGAPVIGFFGGVHGVERIGSQVQLSWLHAMIQRLHWDAAFRQRLERVRVVFMPMINPGGIWHRTRCNPNGVDLMRNAPIDAMGKVPFLVGGHRISRHLPWYRGKRGAPMEPEAQALIRVVRDRLLGAPFSLSLDCHSGFGRRDRLWCCYARSHRPIAHIAEVLTLKRLLGRTYPYHHPYIIEPQSVNYTTHGDLWDFLYDESLESHPDNTFLPFTLEMGSWLWVRKNPKQMLDFFGYFNPMITHRHHRVLRQHLPLFDFLLAAADNWQNWIPLPHQRAELTRQAIEEWFAEPAEHGAR
ncbi:MAG: zinc carboxypeptidase [Alcanivorax sp.]|nr:zinc carboxypeptidase [Alcanivorax sp.]